MTESEPQNVIPDQEPAEGKDELEFIYAKTPDGRTAVVARSQVLWVKARGDYLWIHTKIGTRYSKKGTLKSLEQHWTKHGFVRIHKSFLVFLPYARELRLGGWGWVLTVGPRAAELPVGRKRVPEIRRLLQEKARQVD